MKNKDNLFHGAFVVTVFLGLFGMFVLVPTNSLTDNRISVDTLVVSMICFGFLSLGPDVFTSRLLSESKPLRELIAFSGVIAGIECVLGILSMRVWFAWYEAPDHGYLEPLFVGMGGGVAYLEVVRRRCFRVFKKWEDELQEPSSVKAKIE